MIKLMFLSYIDRKKLMILFIFEVLVLFFMFFIVYEKNSTYEMMLYPNYYITYINQVFLQVFLIVNAMFVLFLIMEHDQPFLKPMISFFGRYKVFIYKYIFFLSIILCYGCYFYMIFHLAINIITPLEVTLTIQTFVYMFLDMILLTNVMLISIKHKYRSLSIIILMLYIFTTLFLESLPYRFLYILPIFNITKTYQMLEISYKMCYILLGFMIYLAKSAKEQL